jgi:tetratricopeptide (TPR) repeat protein
MLFYPRPLICYFLSLVTCLPGLVPNLSAQRTTAPYTVGGRVAQPDDSPAMHAVVKISGESGIDRTVYADDLGRFEIRDLPTGRYYLSATNPAAADQHSEPVLVDLNHADSHFITINIFLRARATAVSREKRKPGVVTLAEEKQSAPKPARKAFEEALKLRNKKRYDQSLTQFGRSIELYPSYFQALAERGLLLMTMGNLPDARKDFERALQLNSRYGPALRGSGLCSFQQGKYAESADFLERAVDAEPGNATDYYFLGISDVALDRREQARAALEKALSLDPVASVRAHVHLASLLIKENRLQDAAHEIEVYLEAVPNPFDGDKLRTLLARLQAAAKR